MAAEPLSAPANLHVAPEAVGVLHDAVRVASTTKLPLELGSVEMTNDGRMAASGGERALRFSFLYKGLPFRGEVAKTGEALLHLVGDFGKLPYTAEQPECRRTVRKLVADSRGNAGGSFRITGQQDIELSLQIRAIGPRTPVSLVATVAAALLGAIPAIEAMTAALASPRHT
jgi:hypothetical protein